MKSETKSTLIGTLVGALITATSGYFISQSEAKLQRQIAESSITMEIASIKLEIYEEILNKYGVYNTIPKMSVDNVYLLKSKAARLNAIGDDKVANSVFDFYKIISRIAKSNGSDQVAKGKYQLELEKMVELMSSSLGFQSKDIPFGVVEESTET